ncbi:fibropellin-1-like [Saccostrea echinata]|uniref:fibropellin-1-like n=1 Tax=Saccostrea echinata TaxID=191078 RepID=UPI002A8190CB|nr:fibropellin-1-like [Saccostrea echinata]
MSEDNLAMERHVKFLLLCLTTVVLTFWILPTAFAICNNNDDCLNGGTCNNSTCNCSHYYQGTTCETFNCTGNNTACNHGVCLASGNCDCSSGYAGNPCLPSESSGFIVYVNTLLLFLLMVLAGVLS